MLKRSQYLVLVAGFSFSSTLVIWALVFSLICLSRSSAQDSATVLNAEELVSQWADVCMFDRHVVRSKLENMQPEQLQFNSLSLYLKKVIVAIDGKLDGKNSNVVWSLEVTGTTKHCMASAVSIDQSTLKASLEREFPEVRFSALRRDKGSEIYYSEQIVRTDGQSVTFCVGSQKPVVFLIVVENGPC